MRPSIVLAAVILLLPALSAPAQVDPQGQGEVQIAVVSRGVGDAARRGELAGVRIELTDTSQRVRSVMVQLRIPDIDGDTTVHQRLVTLNPGVRQGVWMYPRLPHGLGGRGNVEIHVREADERARNDRLSTGRHLGSQRFAFNQSITSATRPFIGVVGRSAAGLGEYVMPGNPGGSTPATAHELPVVLAGIEPSGLPDAWMGLAPFETLVWTQGDPTLVTLSQRDAILEWVRRGGHFVVVLPSVGRAWTQARSNLLADALPSVQIFAHEGIGLEAYRPLLTDIESLPLPGAAVAHTFRPLESAAGAEAQVVLSGPDGAPVVVRRSLGSGAVTLVGLDLAASNLTSRVASQLFWHRVLGKRFDVLSPLEMRDEGRASGRGRVNFTVRNEVVLDSSFGGAIDKKGRAGAGVLLGLLVFTAYLLVAGPVGFFALRRVGKLHHAWVVFVGVVAVFAVVSWGGAAIGKPVRTETTHLTIYDVVHGQETARLRSWVSVLLPGYGDAALSLGDAERPTPWRDVIAPWDDAEQTGSMDFPDTRPYAVDTMRQSSVRFPTRATVRQARIDWLGEAELGMIRPVGAIAPDATGRVRGRVAHDFPAPLKNVQLVLVEGLLSVNDAVPGSRLTAIGRAVSPVAGGEWAAGVPIDLDTLYIDKDKDGTRKPDLTSYLDFGRINNLSDRLQAISWHGVLSPPNWENAGVLNQETLLQRRETHGYDLSRWFTQPCLIVFGQLEDTRLPAPLRVDGREAPSTGNTFVRWVYPLPSAPPAYSARSAPGDK